MKLIKGDKVIASSYAGNGELIKNSFQGVVISIQHSYVEIKDTCPCDYKGQKFIRPYHLIKKMPASKQNQNKKGRNNYVSLLPKTKR